MNQHNTKYKNDLIESLNKSFNLNCSTYNKGLSPVKEYNLAFFLQTYYGDELGKYFATFYMKNSLLVLGDSKAFDCRQTSTKSFLSLERSFFENSSFKFEYVKLINDSIGVPNSFWNHLPHQLTIGSFRTTTSFRVVSDASTTSLSDLSLNNIMHVSPTFQQSLFGIMLRFVK